MSAPDREGQWGAISLAPDGALFRTNDGRLERSTDRGERWAALPAAGETGGVIGYSSLYTVTHTLYSAVRSGYRIAGIQRSTDGGDTWQPSLSGPPLDFDGYQPEMASGFARTYLLLRPYNGEPALLRTDIFGDKWELAPAGTVAGVDHIAVDPVDGRLWLGVKGGVRSLDPEKLKWSPAPPPKPVALTPQPTPCPGPLPRPAPVSCQRGLPRRPPRPPRLPVPAAWRSPARMPKSTRGAWASGAPAAPARQSQWPASGSSTAR